MASFKPGDLVVTACHDVPCFFKTFNSDQNIDIINSRHLRLGLSCFVVEVKVTIGPENFVKVLCEDISHPVYISSNYLRHTNIKLASAANLK